MEREEVAHDKSRSKSPSANLIKKNLAQKLFEIMHAKVSGRAYLRLLSETFCRSFPRTPSEEPATVYERVSGFEVKHDKGRQATCCAYRYFLGKFDDGGATGKLLRRNVTGAAVAIRN
jgi:hypothetical protein